MRAQRAPCVSLMRQLLHHVRGNALSSLNWALHTSLSTKICLNSMPRAVRRRRETELQLSRYTIQASCVAQAV